MATDENGFEAQARLFRALSHPVRLRILGILAREEACVCHLTAVLEQRQPYVSQQLASLREAGLVTDRRDGTLIYYRLANDQLVTLLDLARMVIRDLLGDHLVFAPVPEEALAKCPCPRCQGEV